MYQKLIEEAKNIIYNPPRTHDNRDRLSQIRFALSLAYGTYLLKADVNYSNYSKARPAFYLEYRKEMSQGDAQEKAKSKAEEAFGVYSQEQATTKYIKTVIDSIDVVLTNIRDKHRNEDQALVNGLE